MKKTILFVFALILTANFAIAQVIINLQLPLTGLNVKSQLWNMSLTNTSSGSLSVKINMVMTDIATGQQVLSGTTNLFSLQKGTKIIQYNDVVPVNYTVLNNNYGIDASPNGFLPIGNFNVCFEVIKKAVEDVETLTEDCASVEIEPASPPYLNVPNDEAEIEDNRPLFTWLPPAPLNLFNNLSYSLKLVEILKYQSSATAIQQNFPLLGLQQISGLSVQFPFSAAPLDTGKIYAWQITANNNNLLVAKTDVWTFKIKPASDKAVKNKETPYFKLKTEISSGYFVCESILKFEYTNEINDSLVSVKVYDITKQNKNPITLANPVLKLKNGQNLIDIDLSENRGIVAGHLYTIVLINSKGENWAGKFEFKK
jgi:hypothetical protein